MLSNQVTKPDKYHVPNYHLLLIEVFYLVLYLFWISLEGVFFYECSALR